MNEDSLPNQPITTFTPPENTTLAAPPPMADPSIPFSSPPLPKSSRKRPKLVLVGVIVGGVIAVIVICLVLFRFISGPDYGKSYQLSTQLETEFDAMWGSSHSSCSAMINKANDDDVTATTYEGYADECQQNLTKIWDLTGDLGKSSGITKDSELGQKFTKFEASLSASLPAKGNLEKMKKIFVAIHDFAIRLGTIDIDSSETDIANTAKILIDSGSSDWASFGQGWQTRMLKLLNARRVYEEVKYSDSRYDAVRQEYRDALDDLDEYLSNIDSEEWDNGGFHAKLLDQLEDDLYTLRSAIREVYEQHYDGKNDENCVELSSGEAYCD